MMTRSAPLFLRSLVACALSTGLVACGEPDEHGTNNPTTKPITNNSNNNNTSPTSNPTGTTTPSNNTNNNENNTSTTTTPVNTGLCQNIVSLGTIDASETVTQVFEETTVPQSVVNRGYASQCGFASAPEVGWSFEVQGPTRVRAELTAKDPVSWAMEFRQGASCETAEVLLCESDNVISAALQPGQIHTLVAEPTTNSRGAIEVEVTFEPLACLPIGSARCGDAPNSLMVCAQAGRVEEEASCGAPCEEGVCGADTCEGAVVVESFPFRFEGDAQAYGSHLDFVDANTCENPDTEYLAPDPDDPNPPDPPEPGMQSGAISTPGQDVIFSLPGLQAGQKLTVDATSEAGDLADSALFVLDACDPMQCRIALDLGDKLDGWDVPTSGDYFVVVDRRANQNAAIVVDISVE